jgi:hypothetical protein
MDKNNKTLAQAVQDIGDNLKILRNNKWVIFKLRSLITARRMVRSASDCFNDLKDKLTFKS